MPKNTIIPKKLKCGDTIMVVAPSDSLANISARVRRGALARVEDTGFKVKISRNAEEINCYDSSSVISRVDDLHQAFTDPKVRLVITAFGGYNSNQLLHHLDWDLIQTNPKLFLGFSDITALQNAIYAKTGLVTYSGPPFSRFGQELYFDYTFDYFKKCLIEEKEYDIFPSSQWSDDWWLKNQQMRQLENNPGWKVLHEGEAHGVILGGNLSTFNLLQGTEYLPDISHSILFLEDDSESSLHHFDRDLQSVLHLPNFHTIKALIIGRFQKKSHISTDDITHLIESKRELDHIPVIANVDFGHTDPMITVPIGGTAYVVHLYKSR